MHPHSCPPSPFVAQVRNTLLLAAVLALPIAAIAFAIAIASAR